MTQESQPDPVDVASMEEIEIAWDYFTHLPKGHPNRIHLIAESSSPWEHRTWYHYYTIHYRFHGEEKKIRKLAFTATTGKQIVIRKILKATDLDINEAPIPPHLPQMMQEEIQERRKRQGPKEQKGRGEGIDYDNEDEDYLIMEEINSWKRKKPKVVRLE
jgi:hypothetical protein